MLLPLEDAGMYHGREPFGLAVGIYSYPDSREQAA